MVTRKSQSQGLKAKTEKLEKELEKVQTQKAQLVTKEKELTKQLKAIKAEYIVALMSESGKSIEELERFAKEKAENVPENGGDGHVQNY
ncbi:TPA: hypothetical protein U1D13_001689 [Streptococcus suis]|uniref:hypothetical protein n=1 Tax=Streptococcus TaxID=1301 RepID=UPI001ABE700A|nr:MULTISPECIES: hypothetical protein [Streptococcus]MBO4110412.1 hypothetical protein [Streptococcus suis]WFM79350.1 hypothetical protein P7F70_07385 [Streptococcus pluranimalium]HEM3715624.1 hypothetical protein [Streptococcus suis]